MTDQFLVGGGLGLDHGLQLGRDLLKALLKLVLLDQRDVALAKLLPESALMQRGETRWGWTYGQERLHGSLLLLALERPDGVEPGVKLLAFALNFPSIVTSHGNDTSDTLGDRALFRDDQVLDDVGLFDVSLQCQPRSRETHHELCSSRSTAELDTGVPPLGVFNVLLDLLERVADGHDSDRVGVGFTKDGSETGDLVCLGER